MTVLDTSVLVEALTSQRRLFQILRAKMSSDELYALPSIVVYEWRRGPRTDAQLALQESLFPSKNTIAFGLEEAYVAAEIYRTVRRPRGREADIAIAACALTHEADLWTLNSRDFADIPGLKLASPA